MWTLYEFGCLPVDHVGSVGCLKVDNTNAAGCIQALTQSQYLRQLCYTPSEF